MSWILVIDEEESPRARLIRDRLNLLEELSDNECVQRYRMDHTRIVDLCRLLNADLEQPTRRNNASPVLVQVCTALRFFAQGAFYRVTGDTMGISNGALSGVVHAVANALYARSREFIKFPESPQELAVTKQGFHSLMCFPNVIGAIDCTHVEIIAPQNN